MFRILTTIILIGCSIISQAQNFEKVIQATNVEFLNRYAAEMEQKFNQDKQRALDFCEKYNYPTKVVDSEGRSSEVIGLDEKGNLVYAIEDNLDAARTISADKVQIFGLENYNLSGRGLVAGMWEAGPPRTTHQEMNGRIILGDNVSSGDHASHVGGTIIARGVNPAARGMASEASIKSYDWGNPIAEMASEGANGLLVSNHSWGYINGWSFGAYSGNNAWHWWGDPSISPTEDYAFGRYDGNAQAWDNVCFNAPYFTIVKSAGNQRNENGPAPGGTHYVRNGGSGPWVTSNATRDPDGAFDCQGNMANSKNILSVGAVNAIPGGYNGPGSVSMSSFSSWGPTDDGRIKPDLVANGVGVFSCGNSSNTDYYSSSGTSMSSPTITGSVLLIQEHYSNLNNGDFMRSETVRSLLINTCDEAGIGTGPDYSYGWGLANIQKAAETITDNGRRSLIQEDTLMNGQIDTYQVYSDGTEPLRVSIAWLDPAGSIAPVALNDTSRALVNDLDLRVISTTDTTLPWKLDVANPGQPASKGDNIVDNVEVIDVPNPTQGVYTIQISHKGTLSGAQQTYALVVNGIKTADSLLYCQPLHEFKSFYGNFSDGSGSDSYESNQTCNWKISTTGLAKVELFFNTMDLEPNADFVYVYNGLDATYPLLATITGDSIPAMIRSTGANMFVSFVSDNNNSGHDGFTATYQSTLCPALTAPPTSSFTAIRTGDTCNREFRFFRQATNYDSLRWDYGDGNFSNDNNPIHNYSYANGGTYNVTLTAYGKCFVEDIFTTQISVPCQTVNLNELEETGFAVYPNPNKGIFRFEVSSELRGNHQLTIFDVNGIVHKTIALKSESQIIDITDLADGMYYYRVLGSSINRNGKLIKN